MKAPHTLTIAFDSYHVFGSGAAIARLIIDGVGITHAVAAQRGWPVTCRDNGFVGYFFVTVPSSLVARATTVKYYRGATPGGDEEFEGHGKDACRFFGRRPRRPSSQKDALTVPSAALKRAVEVGAGVNQYGNRYRALFGEREGQYARAAAFKRQLFSKGLSSQVLPSSQPWDWMSPWAYAVWAAAEQQRRRAHEREQSRIKSCLRQRKQKRNSVRIRML